MKRLHSLAEQDILWGRLFTEPWNCQFGFKSGDKTWPSKEAMEPWGHSTLNHGDKCREVAPLRSTHLPFQTRNQPLAGDSGGGGGVSGRAFLLLSGIRGVGST